LKENQLKRFSVCGYMSLTLFNTWSSLKFVPVS
jgi:hypothetical protein